MHDPKTVAHEIKLFGQYFITIWHVDPETNGDEDSCGWPWPHLTERENTYVEALIDNEYDNLRHWFADCDHYDAKAQLRQIFRLHKGLLRPWWKHPRWHFWHWEFQVHPVQEFKRWAFSRCCYCGHRFQWGEAPLSLTWAGTGPCWFRSEKKIMHIQCYPLHRQKSALAALDTTEEGECQ